MVRHHQNVTSAPMLRLEVADDIAVQRNLSSAMSKQNISKEVIKTLLLHHLLQLSKVKGEP